MEQVLSGLRIVEFGNDVAAANVGRLLSAYGAEVVLVEPPEGNILRHLPPYATKTSTSKPDLETPVDNEKTSHRPSVFELEPG